MAPGSVKKGEAATVGMLRTIWKYPLSMVDSQPVELPKQAELLTVQMQHGEPCLWARVDPVEMDTEEITIVCVGTGHPMTEAGLYLGTAQSRAGLVWHFFAQGSELE